MKGVLREFQGCCKEVSRVFHEIFKEEEVSWVFYDFQGCFKSVSKVFQGNLKNTISRCFKKVSCCMALIAASQAEGGLVLYI